MNESSCQGGEDGDAVVLSDLVLVDHGRVLGEGNRPVLRL